jgi:hypothetical protein
MDASRTVHRPPAGLSGSRQTPTRVQIPARMASPPGGLQSVGFALYIGCNRRAACIR